MNPFQVQCNCGAVKIELSGESVAHFYCHCDDCQAVHGAAFVPIVMFPVPSVRIVAGEPGIWKLKTNPRYACRECGTRLFAEPPGAGVRGVVASLLPKGMFKPAFHVQCQHALIPVRDDLPHFKGYPTALGGSDETVSW